MLQCGGSGYNGKVIFESGSDALNAHHPKIYFSPLHFLPLYPFHKQPERSPEAPERRFCGHWNCLCNRLLACALKMTAAVVKLRAGSSTPRGLVYSSECVTERVGGREMHRECDGADLIVIHTATTNQKPLRACHFNTSTFFIETSQNDEHALCKCAVLITFFLTQLKTYIERAICFCL